MSKELIAIAEIPSYDTIQIKKKEEIYYEIVEKMPASKGILLLINKLQKESIPILVEGRSTRSDPFGGHRSQSTLISFIAKYGMDQAIADGFVA